MAGTSAAAGAAVSASSSAVMMAAVAMVAMVKSRSAIAGLTPSGSWIWEMWIDCPICRPVRSMRNLLGNAVGRREDLDLVAHDVEHAAYLQPGDASWFLKWTGTSTRMRASLPSRRKSTWMMKSRTGSNWMSRGMTRTFLPSTSRSTSVAVKRPVLTCGTSSR